MGLYSLSRISLTLTNLPAPNPHQTIGVNSSNWMTSFNIKKRLVNNTCLNDQTTRKSESCTTSNAILAAGLRRIGSTDPIWVTRPSVCPSLYPFLSTFFVHYVRSFVRSFPPFGSIYPSSKKESQIWLLVEGEIFSFNLIEFVAGL